ncbi:sensor histidine kinase [Derxia lacustris]|uniref:sensor histidine kinase n=1 Tax=Derxia lacustris TaxID=764842 RepID=UPI000A175CD6|nr:HAMP domain-containing sensor histidine kinase [Derxia lacustris]
MRPRAWLGRLTLGQRLCAVFTLLLLAGVGGTLAVQLRLGEQREQELVQRLSAGLAAHIAGNGALMAHGDLDPRAVQALFGKLMDVNPSVEVYLLAPDGRIVGDAAPPGHLRRARVDLAPVRAFLAGRPLPIVGDDPRSAEARKVFSAAPLRIDGHDAGYVYVVLIGEDHDALAARGRPDHLLALTLLAVGLVLALVLTVGLVAVRSVTRPLDRLTAAVRGFAADGRADAASFDGALPAGSGDEIALLRQAFAQMAGRIGEQWRALAAQDEQRRELVANISHDLRTPLTSLHGFLETLLIKSDSLGEAERRRYLEVALAQSRKVGRLAQELFELARLEYGVVKPETEDFSLAELVHDVLQKFELAAQARRQRLRADIAPGLPVVTADLGLIERVLTNLLDNAIRHTPEGGDIEVQLWLAGGQVMVQISDSGPGIPAALRPGLFTRAAFAGQPRPASSNASGGLGLIIVRRILELHGSEIRLVSGGGGGAVFRFPLAARGC